MNLQRAIFVVVAFLIPTTSLAQIKFGGKEPAFEELLQAGPWFWGDEQSRQLMRKNFPLEQRVADFLIKANGIKDLGFAVRYHFSEDGTFQKLYSDRQEGKEDRFGRPTVIDRSHAWSGTYKISQRPMSKNERTRMFTSDSPNFRYRGPVRFIDVSFTDQKGKGGTCRLGLNEAESSKYELKLVVADATGGFWDAYPGYEDKKPYDMVFTLQNK
jgi:hypothetical protein